RGRPRRHRGRCWSYPAWPPVLAPPGTPVLIPAGLAAARRPRERVWLAWAVLVPAMMTAVSSKLATYLLPALPPIALIVGAYVGRWLAAGPASQDRIGALPAPSPTPRRLSGGAPAPRPPPPP